jgi:hypothetical protein
MLRQQLPFVLAKKRPEIREKIDRLERLAKEEEENRGRPK